MFRGDIHARAARADDVAELSALALRSKAHWGYDQSFLSACREELTYTEEQINSSQFEFYVYEVDESTVAFYALEFCSASTAELEAMFVEPKFIGRGLGRGLFAHATLRCLVNSKDRLIIQADEYAAEFYKAMGAVECGSRESGSISGRRLPLFEFRMTDETSTKGAVE